MIFIRRGLVRPRSKAASCRRTPKKTRPWHLRMPVGSVIYSQKSLVRDQQLAGETEDRVGLEELGQSA